MKAVFFMLAPALAQAAGVAILDSQNTREFFARHYPACDPAARVFTLGAEEYQRYFRGWQYVFEQEMGITPVLLRDQDVTAATLANYSLLILSNTASLSDDQVKAVHQWVISGGSLIATFGSGYKDVIEDPRQADLLKAQKGGTFGLHQLWHDPVSKVFSTLALDPAVDVRITRYAGPTACLTGRLSGDILHYGALANLLIQRPEQNKDVDAFLVIDDGGRHWSAPAILTTRAGRGQVVYFAFAPEYLVSKEFGLPAPEPCPDGQIWTGRSYESRMLMRCTVEYLLRK